MSAAICAADTGKWQRDGGPGFRHRRRFRWYDPVLQTLAHLGCVRGGSASSPILTLPQYFTLARWQRRSTAM